LHPSAPAAFGDNTGIPRRDYLHDHQNIWADTKMLKTQATIDFGWSVRILGTFLEGAAK